MTIAITGAAGQLGRLVADELLNRVDPSEVVLLTRSPESLAEYAERGATVRAADFDKLDTLPEAFEGVTKMLLISTDRVGDRVQPHKAAISAAVEAGVQHIAYTSLPEPDADNPAQVAPDHLGTETALRESGAAWTMLRNNLYSDMQVDSVDQAVAGGTVFTNVGNSGAAYVTRADCAAVAAAVLSGEGHENKEYDVTGPSAITAQDIAALASKKAGTLIGVTNVDDDAYAAGLVAAGVPDFVVPMLVSFGASIREGKLAHVSDVVEKIGGRKPTPFSALVSK